MTGILTVLIKDFLLICICMQRMNHLVRRSVLVDWRNLIKLGESYVSFFSYELSGILKHFLLKTSTLASRCDRKSLYFIRILPINQPRSKSWRLKRKYRDRHVNVNSEKLRPCELQNQTLDEDDPWTSFLPASPWEIRRTTQTSLQAKPAKLVLGQGMLINIQFKEDWALINAQKQSFTQKHKV